MIERFTRINTDTIRYRFTIDDATAFEQPWTGEIAMSRTTGYGNVSLKLALRGG